MELDEIKTYLRIDDDCEDNILEMLQLEAEEYLDGAGITKNYNKNRYRLAVLLLVSDSYENRHIRSSENRLVNTSDRISRIILQLQMDEGVKL